MAGEENTSSLKYVAPYDIPENNNQKLLSFLKIDGSYSPIIPSSPTFKIPVHSNIDLTELIEANNAKILNANNANFSGSKKQSSLERRINGIADSIDTASEMDIVQKFVDIKDFLPKNLRQQVTTVVLKPFLDLKRGVIETILRTLIPSEDFEWSIINLDVVDSTLVFIRFFTVQRLRWFTQNYKEDIKDILNNNNLEMITDANAKQFLDEESNDELNELAKLQIKHNVDKIISASKNSDKNLSARELKDIDEALSYYSNYKVDYNELIDVPAHLKDMIIKDIVRFRSKVLMIEKENRKKELDLEREKTRIRLLETYEGIKEVNEDMQVDDANEVNGESSRPEEFEELSDEQFKDHLKEIRKKEASDKYQEVFEEQKRREHTVKLALSRALEEAKSYENNLIENKLKSLNEFRITSEMKHIFYTNHSEYVTKRNKRKLREATQDAQDFEEESKEMLASPVKKQDITSKTPGGQQLFNTEAGSIPEEILGKIKLKIEDLIEEYLGVKEDFIVDIIFQFIKDNGIKRKENLIQELAEPLDEDSANLVDDLWAYIETL